MRPTCLKCVLKHLGQALVLLEECRSGYPFHRYYVAGHMAEASSESINLFPDIAQRIRDERKKFEEFDEDPDIFAIMIDVDKILMAADNRPPTELETEPGERPSEMMSQLGKVFRESTDDIKIEVAPGTLEFNKAVPGAMVIDKALQEEINEGKISLSQAIRISKPLHPCGIIACGHSMWDHELVEGKCKKCNYCTGFVPTSAENDDDRRGTEGDNPSSDSGSGAGPPGGGL